MVGDTDDTNLLLQRYRHKTSAPYIRRMLIVPTILITVMAVSGCVIVALVAREVSRR